MCLALPGKIISMRTRDEVLMADVDFSGVRKEICLIYTPEARIGDYVIAHVGFAIALLNVKEAEKTWELLT